MASTVNYLDALGAKLGLRSDASIARALGVKRQSVSRYRIYAISMDDDVALRAADLLGIRPATILLDMYHERTRNPAVKQVWRDAVELMAAAS
jgi:predicted transcriptional regulator